MKKNSPYINEYKAFKLYISGKQFPLSLILLLGLKSLLVIFEMFIRYIPGGIGYLIRRIYYKNSLKKIGKNVLIDVGVFFNGTKNISIGDYVWIDAGCRIDAMLGQVKIGKRVHVAPFTIIASRESVIIEDYVGIGAGVKIYANSEVPTDGKRMSGPMIPEKYKAYYSKKIVLEKDCFIGAGAVILPGAHIGEGAVIGANTVIKKEVKSYDIIAGLPPRVIGRRNKVTVPDL